jgi:branched-chain amino acid transport system substrate-binding protein
MKGLTRRNVLQLGATGAAGLVLGAPAFLRAQSQPVVMLGIWPFTGPFADVGPLLDRGVQLAIEEWGGQVLEKPIKYITRDSETKPGAATRRVEEAIDSEGVQYVIGPWSSGVALAVTEVAKRRKALHYFSGGTEELAGKRCHRYGFQWAVSPYTAMHVVMDKFMELNPQAKRWYLFVSDYAFGWSVEKYIKVAGQKYHIDFVGTDRVLLGTREWSGFVAKAAAAKPDVLCLLNAGQDVIISIREAHNFGLAPQVPVVIGWGVGVEDFVQLDPKNRENLWVGTNAYYTVDTPVAKKYAETYQQKFGVPPGYAPNAAYAMTRLVLRGIEKAKSTAPADVAQALEGWETVDWPGKLRINPNTHQTERDYFFLRCKPEAKMQHAYDFADIIAVGATPLMPTEFNECKDIGTL